MSRHAHIEDAYRPNVVREACERMWLRCGAVCECTGRCTPETCGTQRRLQGADDDPTEIPPE